MHGTTKKNFAVNNEIRNQPAYPLNEAARYVKLPGATLRSWVVGRHYPKSGGTAQFHPIIRPAQKQPLMLSFSNLIEAHVLRALRTDHGVSIQNVRKAVDFAQRQLKIERLLLSKELKSAAGKLFLDRYAELIELTASGQLAIKQMLDAHLRRIEWDERGIPLRLYPFVQADFVHEDQPVAIDPAVAFGRPILLSRGISTHAIVDRIDAGETVSELAKDYDLSEKEVELAVLYEQAA